MVSNLFTNLKYIGSGIKGLISNRVYVDDKKGTIREVGAGQNSEATNLYKNLQPISFAVNKVSNDSSRIIIELQDEDGISISDKKTLDKYYNFLHDKYGQNGISSLYQNLITQIVANLKLNNEYFLRVFYNKEKDVFLGIELIPTTLCIETIGADGYIEQFEVLCSAKDRNISQIFKRIKGLEYVKKTSLYKVSNGFDGGIEKYLIHYHSTNGIDVSYIDGFYDIIPSLRGVSNINLIERSLATYNNAELAVIELMSKEQIQRNTGVAIFESKTNEDNFITTYSSGKHPNFITSTTKPNSPLKTQEMFKWESKNIDVQKDLVHYYNIKTQESRNILQYFGIPTRIVSTEGSAYNNLAVANEEYERHLLSVISSIADFLTKNMAIISKEFFKQNSKLSIKKDSSFLIRKERREDLEIEKEFTPTNEIREEYFDKDPVDGGDTIPTSNGTKKDLTPEEASKQKRKMPHTGERVVKKTT